MPKCVAVGKPSRAKRLLARKLSLGRETAFLVRIFGRGISGLDSSTKIFGDIFVQICSSEKKILFFWGERVTICSLWNFWGKKEHRNLMLLFLKESDLGILRRDDSLQHDNHLEKFLSIDMSSAKEAFG